MPCTQRPLTSLRASMGPPVHSANDRCRYILSSENQQIYKGTIICSASAVATGTCTSVTVDLPWRRCIAIANTGVAFMKICRYCSTLSMISAMPIICRRGRR